MLNQTGLCTRDTSKPVQREVMITEGPAAHHDPKKRLLLSDILNWKSINNTEGSEKALGETSACNFEMANKQLRANLRQIFHGNSKPSDNKKKQEFKIGKSLEVPRERKTSVGESLAKNSSRDLNFSRREGSLHHVEIKKNDQQKEKGEKKSNRPPLPKLIKPDGKFNQVFISKGDLNGQTVKVRVDVQVVPDQKEKKEMAAADYAKPRKAPPKPPQTNQASLAQTKLIKQKTSSQQSLGMPGVVSRNSFISNQRSDKSLAEGSHFLENSRKSLYHDNIVKRPDFIVKKVNTESSVQEVSRKNKKVQWMQEITNQARIYMQSPTNQLLLQHEEFVSSKREPLAKEQTKRVIVETEGSQAYSYSHSQRSTPNLLLKEQELEIIGHDQICMFKRRNSDVCLSSNTKNKIKYFLSDHVTRVFFEKNYKDKTNLNLQSSFFN